MSENILKFSIKTFLTKHKIKAIIVGLAVMVFVIITTSVLCIRTPKDPFDKLYEGQPRESVHNILGTPDRSEYKDENGNGTNKDEYDMKFLGYQGVLEISYYSDNSVNDAHFEYTFQWMSKDGFVEISSNDYDEARAFCLDAIEYFDSKYLRDMVDYDELIWYMLDGTELEIWYDIEDIDICILWN